MHFIGHFGLPIFYSWDSHAFLRLLHDVRSLCYTSVARVICRSRITATLQLTRVYEQHPRPQESAPKFMVYSVEI